MPVIMMYGISFKEEKFIFKLQWFLFITNRAKFVCGRRQTQSGTVAYIASVFCSHTSFMASMEIILLVIMMLHFDKYVKVKSVIV
jgi:hypothetical protein